MTTKHTYVAPAHPYARHAEEPTVLTRSVARNELRCDFRRRICVCSARLGFSNGAASYTNLFASRAPVGSARCRRTLEPGIHTQRGTPRSENFKQNPTIGDTRARVNQRYARRPSIQLYYLLRREREGSTGSGHRRLYLTKNPMNIQIAPRTSMRLS